MKVNLSCKICGEKWKPFSFTITGFFNEHIERHNLSEPQYKGDYSDGVAFREFTIETLVWKHQYFEDSRPDSAFLPTK